MPATPLAWYQVGPGRPVTVPVPPISIGNYAYVLAYDASRKLVVYAHAPEYGKPAAVYRWAGANWEQEPFAGPYLRNEVHAVCDAGRGGIAVWFCGERDERGRYSVNGELISATGTTPIVTSGEAPAVGPPNLAKGDRFWVDHQRNMAVAYDPIRKVTALLTRGGVHELDASGAWSRKADGEGPAARRQERRCHRGIGCQPRWSARREHHRERVSIRRHDMAAALESLARFQRARVIHPRA